jgi:hypothetical protein
MGLIHDGHVDPGIPRIYMTTAVFHQLTWSISDFLSRLVASRTSSFLVDHAYVLYSDGDHVYPVGSVGDQPSNFGEDVLGGDGGQPGRQDVASVRPTTPPPSGHLATLLARITGPSRVQKAAADAS